MNIRPRNIQKYQSGGTFNLADWIAQNPTYYEWYKGIYPNAQVLAGDPLKQNQAHANYNQVSSSHHTTDDLQRSTYNNYLYTSPDQYSSREADIINWATKNNINLNTISDQDFVNTYNAQAQKIRSAREAPQTYNRTGYTETNQIFRNMFGSRSQQGTNHPLYNIGYQDNLEDIEGTSTWQRRMDRYEKRFQDDTPENQKNRTFYITRPDGRKIKVYKKENGDLGLFDDPNDPNSPKNNTISPNNPQNPNNQNPNNQNPSQGGRIPVGAGEFDDTKKNPFVNASKYLPGLLTVGRLWNTLATNRRVYDNAKKAIFPVLQQSYHTHRQVVGDEATKQAYYTRAAQGQTKAAKPFTADADRQMAYQMEAKRVGDQLRAEGDLADNREIRRTSDESMQHAWQNIARDTQVANENVVSIAKAKAAKYNLEAQRHAANGTSWDNALKEIQYNIAKGNAERRAYQNQLDQYDYALNAQNDFDINQAQRIYDEADKAYTENATQANYNKLNEASKKLKEARLNYQKNWYINHPPQFTTWFGRRGGKFDHDAELLYKVSRDAVRHFREMSKQADDSRIKTLPKAIKLKSHPGTRKMQYGGQAPFMVYTPLALGGGEDTTSASTTTSSKGSGNKKEDSVADVMKDLFKDIVGKGLPTDVNAVYGQMASFLRSVQTSGGELDSDDIASLYLRQMRAINELQFSKASFDQAKTNVTNNDGLNEFAVSQDGRLLVQNHESGEMTLMSVNDYMQNSNKYSALTNDQVLHMRAYGTPFNNEILQVVNNGIGIRKIAEYIRNNIGSLGTNEFQQDGYTKKEAQSISTGIEHLRQLAQQGDSRAIGAIASYAQAENGTYKETLSISNQDQQAVSALKYVYNILPNNMRTILSLHGDPMRLIADYISGKTSSNFEYQSSAITGKAAKDSNGNSKSGGDDGLKLDAPTALISGKGYQDVIEFNPGTSYAVTVTARHSGFQKKSGENMGNGITMQEATTSTLDQILDWNKATLGGSRINSTGYNRIMINNNDVVGVDLPVGQDNSKPDFTMLKKLQLLDQELLKRGIEDTSNNWQQVNQICQEIGLPSKYKSDGHLNEYSWNRFAAFQVTADDSVLTNKDAILNDILGIVEDDNIRNQYEQIIQKNNKNYKLGSGFLGFGKQALYQGTVFVPIKSNYTAAALSGGQNITMSQATSLELREREYDQSKIANYKPGMNFNEL